MPKTLADYMATNDWHDLTTEEKLNVMATYVIDLEQRLERAEAEQRFERERRDA